MGYPIKPLSSRLKDFCGKECRKTGRTRGVSDSKLHLPETAGLIDTHVNSEKLGQHAQDLHKVEANHLAEGDRDESPPLTKKLLAHAC